MKSGDRMSKNGIRVFGFYVKGRTNPQRDKKADNGVN